MEEIECAFEHARQMRQRAIEAVTFRVEEISDAWCKWCSDDVACDWSIEDVVGADVVVRVFRKDDGRAFYVRKQPWDSGTTFGSDLSSAVAALVLPRTSGIYPHYYHWRKKHSRSMPNRIRRMLRGMGLERVVTVKHLPPHLAIVDVEGHRFVVNKYEDDTDTILKALRF